MRISFRFNLPKTVQAIAYILTPLGRTGKVKLMKLIYLADRAHFIRYGLPITGDRLFAMPLGPVPSATLDAINGELWGVENDVFPYLHVDDFRVTVRDSPGTALLSVTEIAVLDDVICKHGRTGTWDLVAETHNLPEYKEAYVEGTSRPIPYERIAKFSGNDERFRHDRPVITPEMAAQMTCPFPADADL